MDEPDMTIIPDSVLLANLTNCDAQHSGYFAFEYQDQFYQMADPAVTTNIDTIPGSAYFLSDSVTFFKKSVVITVPLTQNQELIIRIVDVENPLSDCLPLKVYPENDIVNYENGALFCITPNPDNIEMAQPLCSGSSAHIRTIRENGTSNRVLPDGSIEVVSCEDGYISGFFDFDLVTQGRFCTIRY